MELKQVLYLDHKHEPFYLSICECGYEECGSTKVIGPIIKKI